ncbi:hypothetical protein [Hungatella hathewayi]|uniref:hypothetical protein n=1 Tax=Hungatella hathewayi TaxID=154046 RepID=UPI000E4ED92F|nr:hypothetical protein [Hungatella hathewayi]RHB60528.1 hypothetical protein DW876_31030 [Hungatella hathewayi]
MQMASQAYKEVMRNKYRDPLSYIRVTIGVINQEAQSSAYVPHPENYTYYSNLKWPLDNYQVQELYATCDQDYTAVDGSMYFLPRAREDVVLNQGIVSEDLPGSIEIQFPIRYDIKGLTVEFGRAYPVDFRIESDNKTVEIAGNATEHFVTEEIFEGATFLRFVPASMANGQSRFRIHQLTMGIGIYFDNRKILSATKKEHISPIMEELPTLDFDMTIENKDRAYDVENEESTVNFLEAGQEVKVLYGQELDNGTVEWLPGATVYLREWSADDEEMSFAATDRFESMDGTYYKGEYRSEGISLYDLAVDVLKDAGVDSRTYWLDNYLKDVSVCNPMPVVSHKEALQLIANAGRCILYQDRSGNIFMKSSFVPDMEAASDNEAYFSHAGAVLDKKAKQSYATTARDYTDVQPTQYFLPRQEAGKAYLNTGYISEAAAGADGTFAVNPAVEISLEARYKCFGLTLEFGRNNPDTVIFHASLAGEPREDYMVSGLTAMTVISHEFPEFDRLVLEFTKGCPYNRVILNNIIFGDSTDYMLEYGHELTKTPKGTQLPKVRELHVVRTFYGQGVEVKELAKETVTVSAADNRYTIYFSAPSYDLSCTVTEPQAGQTAVIVDSSNYYATVELTGVTGACEVLITGREYIVTQARVSRRLNPTGRLEQWENPLVSDVVHAADLADWVGDYMRADREYDLQYRGEPRIDANDIAFLENKYVPGLLLRVYDHTLKFNGALSGTIKARREIGYVADTQDRLAGK